MDVRITKSQAARSEAAKLLARKRWAGTTAQERSEFAAQVAAQRSADQMGAFGRDPSKLRCPCGEMTLKRAQARGHKCQAPEPKTRVKLNQRSKKA